MGPSRQLQHSGAVARQEHALEWPGARPGVARSTPWSGQAGARPGVARSTPWSGQEHALEKRVIYWHVVCYSTVQVPAYLYRPVPVQFTGHSKCTCLPTYAQAAPHQACAARHNGRSSVLCSCKGIWQDAFAKMGMCTRTYTCKHARVCARTHARCCCGTSRCTSHGLSPRALACTRGRAHVTTPKRARTTHNLPKLPRHFPLRQACLQRCHVARQSG